VGECRKADADRCNWAYRKNVSAAFVYQSAFISCNDATVPSSLMQTGLWRYTPRCNEAQNCTDGSAKLLCCHARRCIERNIEPVILVALSYSRNSVSRNPNGANADLFLFLYISLCVCVCVCVCVPIIIFFSLIPREP